ncbi:MAG TPA: GNAT family N-acetyltransferase [Myxococcales bacterium]|nr:GNAT family N-acetyltransferase [Myxococcales bacterium]HIL80024.1 GNAT family N-acetyltransferase [Myxococcales bacterium]
MFSSSEFANAWSMAGSSTHEHPLDNPVWHALRGRLSRFAASHSTDELVHFDSEVSIFSAVETLDDACWKRVAELVGPEGVCGFFRDVIPPSPAGWEEHFRAPCLQMIAADVAAPSGVEVVRLGADDAPEMLALANLTEPGPFAIRTFELGLYVGVRRNGDLLAMAGERFRVPGFVELSGVCTHPDVRGEGLAGELTLNVVQSIRAGGDEAMLHVLETNENAIRLYQKLGFVARRSVDVVFAQWHYSDWCPSEDESESLKGGR